MEHSNRQAIDVSELVKILEEELEILSITEDEKNLLVRYMVQDILQRDGYRFIPQNITNVERREKPSKEINGKDKKITLH